MIYSRESKKRFISKIETDYLKLGFCGNMGNKGAVVGRFNIEDSSVCIIACHLASGSSQNDLRKSQIQDIQADIFIKEKNDRKLMQIFEHDYKFICGDLNFRIDLHGNIIRKLVIEGNYDELLKYDQLSQAFSQGVLPGYKEALIRFPPTYKFDIGSDTYDSSKKQRAPAWCDRILCNGDIEIEHYSSVDIKHSDHRPVMADTVFRCKQIDANKKEEITELLMKALNKDDIDLI